MAKTMSIIRYKYKADRDFESVQFEGMSCSLGDLKRLIVEKSSRSGTHHPRDDYDLIISNATTHEEYRDSSDLIARNTSVVVARRIRGAFESLTPSSNQKLVVSSDDIVNEYLRPAIFQPTSMTTSSTTNSQSASVAENKAIPLEMLTQSSNNTSTPELSEDEKIKQVVKTSQSRYLPAHRSNTSYTCHNCKQPGHIRNQCPLLLQSSSSTNSNGNGNGNGSLSSSGGDNSSKPDSTQSTGSGSTAQSSSHSSHIITNQSPYQLSYHHNNHHHHHHHGNRPHHRGQGHPRNEPLPKKPTGIPRDGLIQIPRHISGALRDQTGASVVPWQMAQLFVEKSEKKADALAQRARQFQEKGVLPPAPPPSMLPTKSTDEEPPPDDLLCPLCKQVYSDAVITPCCHNSFCDECIRTALVESEDHECPHCHRQQVAIDQINPNLFLRKHVSRWREERQQKSSYSYGSTSQQASSNNYSSSQTLEQDFDLTPTRTSGLTNNQNLNDIDEYDVAILSTISQPSVVPVKTAPIVIKMQSIGRSPSPSQPLVLTKPADMTFEDGKAPDTDQTTSSQKDINSELSATTNNVNGETLNTIIDTNVVENEKSDRQTPPSQVAPVSTILSSPPTTTTTTMAASTSVVPHYYPTPPHILPHQQHIHHGIMYPQQIPPTSSNGHYPMQSNFYSPPMHVSYPGAHHPMGGPPLLPMNVPGGGLHHYPNHPPYLPPHHHHHHLQHQPIVPPHLQPNRLNGFHAAHYETANVSSLHHPNTTYVATSTSTLIPHHNQTTTQSIPTSSAPALSKDEFYLKQRYLQRIQRSTSRRRSHSRSSSYSSYTSSDSRSSSFSRHDDRQRHRRRSSRSRSHQRPNVRRRDDNRAISPNRRQEHRSIRSNSKQRRSPVRHRSPSYRDRRRPAPPPPPPPPSNDKYSSNYRRPSPRPYQSTRERERRRSPRPPPTIPQSTQRTIVYTHESSSSKQNSGRERRRTKSRSRNRSRVNDDRTAPSSKSDQQSQSESILSSSPMTVPLDQQRPTTLLSTITSVNEENSSNNIQSNDTTEDKNSNSGKKRKKHHHKKHRRHHSKSPSSKIKKHRHSKDEDTRTIVDNSTPIIEAQ